MKLYRFFSGSSMTKDYEIIETTATTEEVLDFCFKVALGLKTELKNYKLVLSSEDYLIPMDLRKPIPNCIDIDLDDFSKLVDKYI